MRLTVVWKGGKQRLKNPWPGKLVCAKRRREPLRIPTAVVATQRSERMFRRHSDLLSHAEEHDYDASSAKTGHGDVGWVKRRAPDCYAAWLDALYSRLSPPWSQLSASQ